MKRILISGGTGFIGGHLVRALLERGDEVSVLSRDPARVSERFGTKVRAVRWDPSPRDEHGGPQAEWLSPARGVDAVVHLAGEQAVGRRYTEDTKRRIRDSRVEGTLKLVEAIAEADPRPRVFVCASGVDFYRDLPWEEPVDETSGSGTSFHSSVAQDWEAAALRASDYGVRVVRTRFGIVLGQGGGSMVDLARPFKLFVGGPIGSGHQVVSWIHVHDAARALIRVIDDETISGPVNVTSPHAVTSEQLANAIGHVLGRPVWLRVPASALRALFGEGAEPILSGRRVLPRVLQRVGFEWRYPEIQAALGEALAKG